MLLLKAVYMHEKIALFAKSLHPLLTLPVLTRFVAHHTVLPARITLRVTQKVSPRHPLPVSWVSGIKKALLRSPLRLMAPGSSLTVGMAPVSPP